MREIPCEQYGPDWWEARRGVATASEFSSILTAKKMELSRSADAYICDLISQRYDPYYPRIERTATLAMESGTILEPKARRWYEFETGRTVRQTGICLTDNGYFGASPDGLVGADGGLELKSPLPKTHVQWLLEHKQTGQMPSEHLMQVHGCLIVTGRAWWDFMSWSPGLPSLLIRVTPNEVTDKLKAALIQFQSRRAEIESILGLPPAELPEPPEATAHRDESDGGVACFVP